MQVEGMYNVSILHSDNSLLAHRGCQDEAFGSSDALAELLKVPDISPVVESMDNPAGKPTAENVSESPFGSVKLADTFWLKVPLSVPTLSAIPEVVGVLLETVRAILSMSFRTGVPESVEVTTMESEPTNPVVG